MASTRDIQKRIKSVKSIAQITKAMEAVSANRMRKSQSFAIEARPYAVASLEMLENLLGRTPNLPAILQGRPVKKSLLVIVTGDKGLAGAYNANVLRAADKWVHKMRHEKKDFVLITVGKKAKEHFTRKSGDICNSFAGFSDYSKLKETHPIADVVVNGFASGLWDEAFAVYTNFKTTLRQEVAVRKILPVTKEGIVEMVLGVFPEYGRYAPKKGQELVSAPKYSLEYIFEPSPEVILSALIPKLLHMHMHHIILEANASEHSARMVAMKNASNNAKDIIGDLTLVYNKVRQAGITRELIEITAGSEALKA